MIDEESIRSKMRTMLEAAFQSGGESLVSMVAPKWAFSVEELDDIKKKIEENNKPSPGKKYFPKLYENELYLLVSKKIYYEEVQRFSKEHNLS